MFKVACSRKEASCIIGSLLVELAPVCEKCGGSPDGVLNLQTEAWPTHFQSHYSTFVLVVLL